MPREGYASLTIREETHQKLKEKYEKIKDHLALQGISTFGGYCTLILEEMLEKDDPLEDIP